MNPGKHSKAPHIAIVGSTSPLGKELREMLEDSGFPTGKTTLLETEEYAGLLQEFAGEISVTEVISPSAFDDVDIAFFTCGPEIADSYAASGASFPALAIDLTGRACEGAVFLCGISDASSLKPTGYYVNPHPAAIALGRTLASLDRAFGLTSSSATVHEPASERCSEAIDELQDQTVSLLNFQPVPHRIFGGQLAFNILCEPGVSQRTETRVRRELRGVFANRIPLPRLMALQAPVFHGYGMTVFADLASTPSAETVAAHFAGESGTFAVHSEGDAASPVRVVGNDRIHVGRVLADPDRPGAFALWIAVDSLRLAASNAIQTAERLMFAPASQG
jgi:aspartate-semialdehyde dehydrogenase